MGSLPGSFLLGFFLESATLVVGSSWESGMDGSSRSSWVLEGSLLNQLVMVGVERGPVLLALLFLLCVSWDPLERSIGVEWLSFLDFRKGVASLEHAGEI